MSRPPLWHFYHCYAHGDWSTPVTEHLDALTRYGLLAELDGFHVGFVGSPYEIAAARAVFRAAAPGYTVCVEAGEGWEQETLEAAWEWSKDHDGLLVYAHTKGAARADPVQTPWRREMLYHTIVDWRTPVGALVAGAAIAGCHWIRGAPSSVPGYGTGGMFGGNFWWVRAELLRLNPAPDRASRFCAEHWLGQLSEVTPLTAETICDLNPASPGQGRTEW